MTVNQAEGESQIQDGASSTQVSSSRIEGLDLARAVAFLGMVFVNFRTSIVPKGSDAGFLAWVNERLDGRAAATFVTLAGVGISLMSRRARLTADPVQVRAVRRTLLRRAGFLLIVGLLYWPLWPADILHYYGVYLAFGSLLLTAADGVLLTIVSALVITFAGLVIGGLDYSRGWHWETLSYDGFWTPSGFTRNLVYNGFHPVIPWLGFLVLGMWLGRRDLLDAAFRRRAIMVGLCVAVTAEWLSRCLIRWSSPKLGVEDATSVFGTAPMPPMPL